MLVQRVPQWAVATVILVTPAASRGADPFLPADAQVVVTLNVRQVLASPLVRPELGAIRAAISQNTRVKATCEALGFDPLKDLDTVTFAGKSPSDLDRAVIVAHGRFDVARFRAKAEAVAREKSEMLKIMRSGGHTLYRTNIPNQGKTLYVAIPDAGTIVAATKPEAVVTACDGGGGRAASPLAPQMVALLTGAEPSRSVSVASLGGALAGLPGADHIDYLVGGIQVEQDVRADFRFQTKDADAAQALTKFLRESVDQAKGLLQIMATDQKQLTGLLEALDTVTVADHGPAVTVKARLGAETIKQLGPKPQR